MSGSIDGRPVPRTEGDPDDGAEDAARTGRVLLICVSIGFSVGIAVLVFSIWLDWT